MSDALARLAPVARPLLREVDNALATLGAPAEHPIWALLRRLGVTPADAVTFFVDAEPGRLTAAADSLHEQSAAYADAVIPATIGWQGSAGEAYGHQASALSAYQDGMVDRLAATAAYAQEVGAWLQRSRGRVAVALAEVMGSAQAVTVRGGLAEATASGTGMTRAVLAAADIGAWLLTAVDEALADGQALPQTWAGALSELSYVAPAQTGAIRADSTIRLSH